MTLYTPNQRTIGSLIGTVPKRGTEHLYGKCTHCGKDPVYLWRFVDGKGYCVNCAPKPPAPNNNAPAVGSLTDLSAAAVKMVYQDTGDPQARVDMFLAQWRASRAMSSTAWHLMTHPPTSPAPYMPARGADLEDRVYLPQYEWAYRKAV